MIWFLAELDRAVAENVSFSNSEQHHPRRRYDFCANLEPPSANGLTYLLACFVRSTPVYSVLK